VNFEIIIAHEWELSDIIAIDNLAKVDESRRSFISESVKKRETYLAKKENEIVGYLVFNKNSFFDQNFIWLLFTSLEYRRIGVATALLSHIESLCRGQKLFTSTNKSNKIMQNLLAKLGYSKCGFVENIGESDPEVFLSSEYLILNLKWYCFLTNALACHFISVTD
jgi:GNAT superfamily N-acetyltransferase